MLTLTYTTLLISLFVHVSSRALGRIGGCDSNSFDPCIYTASTSPFPTNEPHRDERLAWMDNEDAISNTPIPQELIDLIVQRTVTGYMRLIQTKHNWLEEILYLIREEREFRWKHNCSTDACIYKIQIFTTHLPDQLYSLLLFDQAKTLLKRPRRSFETSIPNNTIDEKNLTSDETISENFISSTTDSSTNNVSLSPSVNSLRAEPTQTIVQTESPILDDALRLPENPSASISRDPSKHRDNLNSFSESDGKHSMINSFENRDRINMEKMSPDLLTKALSQKQHTLNKQLNDQSSSENHYDLWRKVKEINLTKVPNSPVPPMPVTMIPLSTQTNGSSTTENGNLLSELQENDADTSSLTEIEMLTGESILTEGEYISLKTESTLNTESISHEHLYTKLPEERNIDENISRQSEQEGEQATLLMSLSFPHSIYMGEPYENCTGRFEHYCYNAHKCVYLSVLDTAVCYCRTGYTGVRCDMFNLPQTLYVLKSFKKDDELYKVIEATARYTVNVVVQEELITKWNHAGMN